MQEEQAWNGASSRLSPTRSASTSRARSRLHSSLIDDLGRSIDFLDLVFRLERAFGLKIPEDDIWKGSLNAAEPESFERASASFAPGCPTFAGIDCPQP